MSDNECTKDNETNEETEHIAAEKRRIEENVQMKKNWNGNIAKFSESFSLFMKNNPPLTSDEDRFFIAQLQFTNGEQTNPNENIMNVIHEICDAHFHRAEKNEARIAKEIAAGKPPPSIPNFIKFYEITSVIHLAYDDGVSVVISAKNSKIAHDIYNHINKKLGNNNNHGCGFHNSETPHIPNTSFPGAPPYHLFVTYPKEELPSKNPYIDCDLIHKAAFDYFIENKITARSEDDVDASEYFSIY
jgi:hypothetical protein